MGELRELGERAERMREAYERREPLCLPAEWMPLAHPALAAPDPWPEPVRVYVPVVVIEVRDEGAAVGPHLNSRPLMVPWHDLRLVRDCPESYAGVVREIVGRWDSLVLALR